MKIVLTLLSFLMIHLNSNAQTHQKSKKEISKNYKKYWKNGNLKESGTLDEDGKKTGEIVIYYEDGSIHAKLQYSKGVANGNSENYYYRTGKIWDAGRYENGKKEGEWKDYHKNGQLKSVGIYTRSKKWGV